MTRLMTLSGNQAEIYNSVYYPAGLSDVEAGILFLNFLVQEFKNQPDNFLGKCGTFDVWCKTKNLASDVYDGTKEVIGTIAKGTGNTIGKTVRLLTDKEVIAGLTQYASAYSTGGASAAAQGPLDSLLAKIGGGGLSLASLGDMFKKKSGASGAISSKHIMIGGAAIGTLLIFSLLLKK